MKQLGRDWEGDQEQNTLADFKVAQSVKRSFLNYEKSRNKNDPKYFEFWILYM